MSYAEFLVRPYNLAFVAAAVAGLGVYLWGRWRGTDVFLPVSLLVALAVWGLTLNGAVHDLGLGDPGRRFPAVLAGSAVLALLSGLGATALRDRYFPRVETVRFNERGHEGAEARVVSRSVGAEPASGRAQWNDGEGVLHLVRCHTLGDSVRFGTKVLLEEFDDEHESYLVSRA